MHFNHFMVVQSLSMACDTPRIELTPSFDPILGLGAAVRRTIHFFGRGKDVLEDAVR
jgi:hypothetical protein